MDSKYHLPINTASASHLNRAITHGADKGNFVLPKGLFLWTTLCIVCECVYCAGPSGKVKLAPRKIDGVAKEVSSASAAVPLSRQNTKPPSQRPVKVEPIPIPKAKATTKKPSHRGTKTKVTRVSGERAVPSKAAPATRKYTSAVKKARISTSSGRRVPARKAAAKRGSVKRVRHRKWNSILSSLFDGRL